MKQPKSPAIQELGGKAFDEQVERAGVHRPRVVFESTVHAGENRQRATIQAFFADRHTYQKGIALSKHYQKDVRRFKKDIDTRRREPIDRTKYPEEPTCTVTKADLVRSVVLIRATTGLGKTRTTVEEVSAAVQRAREAKERFIIALFVPTHRLADEVVEVFTEIDPSVAVQRIRRVSQIDPESREPMCLREPEANAWIAAGLPLSGLCKRCPHRVTRRQHPIDSCQYRKQWQVKNVDVWVMPHAYLYFAASIPKSRGPTHIVIDEGFVDSCFRGTDKADRIDIPIEAIERAVDSDTPTAQHWNDRSERLADVLRGYKNQFVPMGVLSFMAGQAVEVGYRLLNELLGVKEGQELKQAVAKYDIATLTSKIQLWRLLVYDQPLSQGVAMPTENYIWPGRRTLFNQTESSLGDRAGWNVRRTAKKSVEVVELRWREFLASRSDAPALVLDATGH